jgi:DNA-binding SARP family transcriptional activator/WD40 repeat protein/serine/threonine protein kinase
VVTGNGEPSTRRVGRVVRFSVLGPVTVTEGSTPLNIGGPKQRAVLAKLIAHAGDPVSVDSIIEAVWGDDAASNAKRIVQTYVATLRSEVGDTIVKTGSGWRLEVDRDQIDAAAFEDLYQTARDVLDSNPQRASVALRDALAMWQGHPYSDIEAHGALEGEISRLTELRVAAQAARIDADLALGRDADLVGEIEALMAEHPYSERFRAHHMLALYRAGRQKEALRSYEQMRSVLLEELGVDPTPDLQELEGRILDQDDSLRVAPTQTIQRRAVLVADPGDPIEIGHLPATERETLLERAAGAVQSAIRREGDGLTITAGTTTYVVFDNALAAANVAEAVTRRLDGEGMRMAIDWGDMVLENGRVSGPPVSRAAVMAAVAHKGQVVLSADAQQAIGTSGNGRGLRFENLGSYDLHGVEGSVLIYQLLVGDVPPVFPNLETHRLPPPLPGGGDRSVPGYELREALGPGSVGTLYRAFQPSVGREVLVEVIGRGESSDADFVRNFEADAQRLTLLDHQNIAQVVDYWRQPDGAFLVYRYPRGGLLSQGVSVDAGRLIEQIGSALSYAHSLGMAHGSVRPDRIALDEAGNASLLCFPIAGIEPGTVDDYARFVAPEDGSASATVDVYSLGVLAGDLGLDGPAVERATSSDPGRRQSSVADFLVELNPLDSDSPSDRYTETRNPYKGLAAFHERDAADFFGRATATDELCRALEGSKLLTIVGPSGIGKSSVARAGLAPALRSGRLSGSDDWLITDMLPGSHPFLELQRALERVAVDLPVGLTEALASHDPNALQNISAALPDGSDLVVLVDQFEELFTMVPEPERAAFLDLLGTSIRAGSVCFVLTLRADFLDRPLRYSDFGGLLKASTVMLAAPNPNELGEAIVKPAKGVGVEVAPELVERMVTEVHDQPGALPLLQHTLVELFSNRRSDLIGLADYEQIGGVSGSLARRAESIYHDLDDDERAAIQQVFLRLVTIVDESAPTRRRVRWGDLHDLGAEAGIEAFARSRMLVFDNDPDTRAPTVEVAHEALLTQWPRLAGWIEATREDLALQRRLTEAIQDWQDNDRDAAYLLTGGRLARHQGWTETTSLALTETEREFLGASIDHNRRLRARRRHRRNVVTAGFAVAAVIAAIFGLVAVQNARDARVEALSASAVAALGTDPELSVLLALEAMESNPDSRTAATAMNQALQDHRTVFRLDGPSIGSMSPDGTLLAAATWDQLQVFEVGDSSHPLWTWSPFEDHYIGEAYFSSDGTVVIVVPVPFEGCDWDRFTLFDARTGDMIGDHDFTDLSTYWGGPAQNGPFIDLDRPIILSAGGADDCGLTPSEGMLMTVDLQSGEQTPLTIGASAKGRSFFGMPTMSEDGARMATAGNSGGAVIDLDTGEERLQLLDGFSTLNEDGSLLLAGNSPLELWDVQSGEKLREFPGYFRVAWFSPSESMVYGSTLDGRILVFDAEFGDLLYELRGHGAEAVRIQMSDDESRIATFAEGSVRVWDVTSPLSSTAGSAVFSAGVGGEPAFFVLTDSYVTSQHLVTGRGVFSDPNALRQDLPTTNGEDAVAVYDLRTGALVSTYPGSLVAVAPGGDKAALQRSGPLEALSESETGGQAPPGEYLPYDTVAIVDLETGEQLSELPGLCRWYDGPPSSPDSFATDECVGYPGPWKEYIANARFSSDGSLLAIAGETGRFAVWDVETREMVWSMDTPDGEDRAMSFYDINVAFSPDDRYLLTSLDGGLSQPATITVREVGSFDTVVDEFETVSGGPSRMEFTPDGRFLVLNDLALNVIVVDTEDWEPVRTLRGQQGIYMTDVAVDPTGRFVATAGQDSESWVWDIETGEEVKRFVIPRSPSGLRNVEWVDESTLMLGTRYFSILVTVDPVATIDLARQRITRSFTTEECVTYDIDPCPTLEEMRSGS